MLITQHRRKIDYLRPTAWQRKFIYGIFLFAAVFISISVPGRNLNNFGQDTFIRMSKSALLAGKIRLAQVLSPNVVEAATGSTSTPTGATLTPGPIQFPAGFMKSVKSYGAVGNGIADDTAAIQAALNDGRSDASGNYYGLPKALYFPPGKYRVTDTLSWNGCCVSLQGAGTSSSIIFLAPGSSGFNGPGAKPVILTPGGNASFHQNIRDIGIEVGSNNPGAVGVDFISNNTGGLNDVSITSDDGQGIAGLSLTRHYPGPMMIKNLYIHGFQVGITTAAYEYGVTIEGLSLLAQTVAGLNLAQQDVSIRNLYSHNTMPAVINKGGFVSILDASLTGGRQSLQAIQYSGGGGGLYLRNISSTGYSQTVLDSSGTVPVSQSGTIAEYVSGTPQALAGTPVPHSLNLPVQETPAFSDTNLSNWAAFTPSFYGDTSTLQATLNSGASTIYFPFGAYLAYNEAAVTVPDTVHRIVGFSSVVNGSTAGANGGGVRLIVDSTSTSPLVVEQFGYGIKVDQQGTRPVVIKNGRYTYTSYPGAGNLFLEDVELPQTTFQAGQSVWARQLDDEFTGTKITNNGNLWILGLKTEQPGIVIDTAPGGQTELLGNVIYPVRTMPANSIAFQDTDANVSYLYTESVYCSTCGYGVQVSETRDGVNNQLGSNQGLRYVMHLFVGY